MQNAAAVDGLNSLAAQLSLNAFPVDLESVYKSFCKIIDEQLETRTLKRPKGSHDCNKAWWNEEMGALAKRVRYTLKAWERDKTSIY